MSIPALSTKEQMTRYLSLRGVIGFSDHEDTGIEDDDVVDDCIRRASGELIGFLHPLYSQENLALSEMVSEWATALACFYLTKRAGNSPPESLYEDYDRIMGRPDGLVEQVRKGRFVLPGVPKTGYNTPTLSNVEVIRLYGHDKLRVKPNSSRNPSVIKQNKSPHRYRF